MRYALVGSGRMGQAIDRAAAARNHERVARFDSADWRELGTAALADADVAFEFSLPAEAAANLTVLAENGISAVCGTTGWTPDANLRRRLESAPHGTVIAPNFSLGMNLFSRIVRLAGGWIASAGQHDPYVTEAHHRGKQDVPSGTAKALAQLLLQADPRLDGICEGHPDGPLPPGRLPVLGLRIGCEPGRHVVGFDGEHDSITLEHRARGREGFALGAVLAAEWVCTRTGLYDFDQVVDDLLGSEPTR